MKCSCCCQGVAANVKKVIKEKEKGVVFLEHASLFNNSRFCAICRGSLPDDYEDELCPFCKENQLFSEVKDYIRSKDVTEYRTES